MTPEVLSTASEKSDSTQPDVREVKPGTDSSAGWIVKGPATSVDRSSAVRSAVSLNGHFQMFEGWQPGAIGQTPDVMGGDACVGRTRIPVWLLIELRQQGASDEELLSDYPRLSRQDLNAAWDFARANPEIVGAQLLAQYLDEAAESVG